MPEILKAAASAIDAALRGDEQARAFAHRLRSIMGQVGTEQGALLAREMQNHLIGLAKGKKLDRYAAVAIMILVAQNSLAEWIVEDERGPLSVDASDPRVIAVEALQRQLLYAAVAERSAEKVMRSLNPVEGNA